MTINFGRQLSLFLADARFTTIRTSIFPRWAALLLPLSWQQCYYVYIMASQRNGTLYTGVTSDLGKRAYQHRHDIFRGFTSKYDVHRLVWYEVHQDVNAAIRREKCIKKWRRAWKLDLIEAFNPYWEDLFARDPIHPSCNIRAES